MIDDSIKVTGSLEVLLHDKDGNLKTRREIKNLVVTTGKILIASRLVNAADDVPSHMAIGDDNTAAAAGQTELISQLARVALGSTSRTNNTITYSATFNDGVGTGAVVEAGIFNDGTAGSMLNRTTFDVVNKDVTDVLTINWNVTIN